MRLSRCRGGRDRSRLGADSSPLRTMSLKRRPARWRSPAPSQQMRAGRPWKCTRSLASAEPAVQAVVVREQLEHRGVGARDVLRVAAQRDPAERAPTLAELIADVRRNEARVGECVGEPRRSAPGRAASCRSRTPRRRGADTRPSPRSDAPSTRASGACTPRDHWRGVSPRRRGSSPRGCSRSAGRARSSGR